MALNNQYLILDSHLNNIGISMSNTSDSINKTIVDNTNATNPKVSSVMFIRMAYRHRSLQ